MAVAFAAPVVELHAAGDDPHWTIELPVDAPTNVGDPFVLHLTLRLVGPPVGTFVPTAVSTTYRVTAIEPDGTQRIVYDHAAEQANVVGTVERIPTSLWPMQNGEWTFRVEQFVGDTATVVAEPHVFTDKAPEPAVPAEADAAAQLVSGLRVDPSQPVVGQPATIVVVMANQPVATIVREVPIHLIDDEGMHLLGRIANPGAGGTATLVWVPRQAAEHATLQAGDQLTDVIVVDAPAPPADMAADSTATDTDGGSEPDQ